MKKKFFALLALSAILMLSSCSASSTDTVMSSSSSSMPESAISTTTSSTSSSGNTSQYTDGLKLVYSGNLTLETTEFDVTSQGLSDLVTEFDGYFSSSSVNQYGGNYRYGEYTVRIPAEHFDSFRQSVSELSLVTRDRTSVEDISSIYYDTQGRLETQQIKLERLQALLEQAETMEDLITIESAISDTQWQIDNLSGEMNNYNSIVDYATINLTINEVYQLSNGQEAPKTFGERIGNGLIDGGANFLNGLEDVVVMLSYNWATLVLIAVVIFGVTKVRPKLKLRKAITRSKSSPQEPETK